MSYFERGPVDQLDFTLFQLQRLTPATQEYINNNLERWVNEHLITEIKAIATAANLPQKFIDGIIYRKNNKNSILISNIGGISEDAMIVFRTRKDGKVCPICRPLEGKTYRPNDPAMPVIPVHKRCRCHYGLVTDDQEIPLADASIYETYKSQINEVMMLGITHGKKRLMDAIIQETRANVTMELGL